MSSKKCGCVDTGVRVVLSSVWQILTPGHWPALMTIDNNLSLFDFQPNSLMERGNQCLKNASDK